MLEPIKDKFNYIQYRLYEFIEDFRYNFYISVLNQIAATYDLEEKVAEMIELIDGLYFGDGCFSAPSSWVLEQQVKEGAANCPDFVEAPEDR